jgi:hypothetical protein
MVGEIISTFAQGARTDRWSLRSKEAVLPLNPYDKQVGTTELLLSASEQLALCLQCFYQNHWFFRVEIFSVGLYAGGVRK